MTKTMLDQVWTLVIDSGCGTGVRVFRGEMAAYEALESYARDRWRANPDRPMERSQGEYDALPPRDAIAVYFDGCGCDEWYVIEQSTVEG